MKIYRNNVLIEASTVDQLDANIHRGFPSTTKRQHIASTVKITDIEYIDYPESEALRITSKAAGTQGTYDQTVLFKGVEFTEQTDDSVTVAAAEKLVHFTPILLAGSNVQVKCTCLDFHHRFAAFNNNDESLFGPAPDPYIRKTTTRPPANPLKVPGLCKHLLKLLDTLQQRNVVI